MAKLEKNQLKEKYKYYSKNLVNPTKWWIKIKFFDGLIYFWSEILRNEANVCIT